MSRTAIKSVDLFIVGQIAIIAILLCLTSQMGYAQSAINIRPEWVGRGSGGADYNGYVIDYVAGGWYYHPGSTFPWQLQLGDQNHRGGIRLRSSTSGSNILRFDGDYRGTDPLSLSGGAMFIYEATRFDFSADYAHTSPATGGAFFLTPAFRSALIFENNRTTMNGGAVSITRTEVNFINTLFNNNHTVSLGTPTTQGGGAIHNVGGRLSFTDAGFGDSIFRGHMYQPGLNNHNVFTYRGGSSNTSAQSGGAIHSTGGSLTFNANAGMSISTTASATGITSGGTHDNQGVPGPAASRVPTYIPGVTSLSSTRSQMVNRSDPNRANTVPWSRSLTDVWAYVSSIPNGNPGNAWFDAIIATQTANTFIDNHALDGHGGAIFADGTDMEFTARAEAVANAEATGATSTTVTGDNPVTQNANASAETLVSAFGYGGYFERNTATISGGAIYTRNGTLTFEARDTSATANATATATASVNADAALYVLGEATSSALAEAYADARAGYFVNNEAFGRGAQDGGGAIYNERGTLDFTVRAVTSTATARATSSAASAAVAGAIPPRSRSAWAYADAYSWAYAAGGYFENNRAQHGGAIFSTGTLNFNATASVNATSDAGATANNATGPAATAFAWSYAGGGFARAFGGYFVNNVARMGGAIFNDGTLTARTTDGVSESWHTGGSGSVGGSGSGFWVEYWAGTDLAATRFDDNRATVVNGYGGLGGAIYNTRNGTLEFFGRSVFLRNVAELDGGIIYNDGGTVLFDSGGWWIQHMERNYAGRHGGAIYNTNDGTITITQSSFFRSGFDIDPSDPGLFNSSRVTITQRGGAIYNDDGVLDLGALYHTAYWESAVRFRGNSAVLTGGAIHNTKDGIVDLLGVTFDNNIAEVGGAIYNEGGELNVNGGRNADGTPWRRPDGQHYSLFSGNGIEETDLGGDTITLRGGAIFNTHGIATDITGAPIIDPDTGAPVILIGRLTSDNTRFQFNHVLETGGAIHNTEHGTFTFTDVSFVSNIAGLAGGALWNAGTGSLTDSRFVQNSDGALTGGVGGRGGAIFNTSTGTLTFTNVTFLGNIVSQGIVAGTGQGSGGAIYNEGGELIFSDAVGAVSNFFANKAYYGGAIFNDGATLTMEGSRFGSLGTIAEIAEAGSNTARYGGAIFNTNRNASGNLFRGVVNLTDVIFEGNQATDTPTPSGTGFGGAIYNEVGLVRLEGVTFSANTASLYGGAIYHSSLDRNGNSVSGGGATVRGELNLFDVNFINNIATATTTSRGGAIYSRGGPTDATRAIINLNVSAGETSTFSGNRREGIQGPHESIFFSGRNEFNVNISTGGRLDMLDPMGGGDVAIRQTGNGTWLLAGNNDLSDGTTTFTVGVIPPAAPPVGDAGTLLFQLHNFGTTDNPNWRHTTLNLGTGVGNVFTLGSNATLEIGETATVVAGITRHDGSAITAHTINLQGSLIFNLTTADIDRTDNSDAVLTLTGNTINVGTADSALYVGVYLDQNATNIGGIGTWFEWFEWFDVNDSSSSIGDNGILVINANGNTVYNPDNEIAVHQWDPTLNNGAGDWRRHATIREMQNNVLTGFGFVIDSHGMLKLGSVNAEQWHLDWGGVAAGAAGNTWDVGTTANWFRQSGGTPAERFYSRDHVRFGENYIDAQGQTQTVALDRRQVNITGNATTVSTMVVDPTLAVGRRYTFNLSPGITLAATAHGRNPTTGATNITSGSINFGSSTVNVVRGTTATPYVPTTISAASATGTSGASAGSITFGPGSVLRFNLTGAVHGNTILNLTAANINLTGATIQLAHTAQELVSAVTLGHGQSVRVIDTTGTVTGLTANVQDRLGNDYSPYRSDQGILYSFSVVNNDLILSGVLAPGYTIRWTGTGGNDLWDTTTANWLGNYQGPADTDPLLQSRTHTFRDGDIVLFANDYLQPGATTPTPVSATAKRVVLDTSVNVLSMSVTGSGYNFVFEDGASLSSNTAGTSIVFAANNQLTINGTATITANNGNGTISFRNNDFEFNTNGVANNDHFLTLNGNVISRHPDTNELMSVGGGRIILSHGIADSSIQRIRLIEITGSGTVTSTGTLMIGDNPYFQQRSTSPTATMLGLKAENNDKELWLVVADASAQAELHWTGVNNMGINDSVWSTDQNNNANNTNWAGETTEGVGVHSFLHGDRVIFAEHAHGAPVTNRVVNVVSGGVTVASMNVTDTGYTFNLRQGGITANANASTHAGATGTGNINFGHGTTIISGVGSRITATNGTITFGRDAIFEFDLSGANTISPLLTLSGNVVVSDSERIGSGDIYVSLPSATMGAGDQIILVDAGANNAGVTTNTGNLYIGSSTTPHSPTRSASGGTMFGLATNGDVASQLLLKWVDAAGLSSDLGWIGKEATQVRDGRNTYDLYIWGTSSASNSFANWRGQVDGVSVDTFLHGDTVRFAELDGANISDRQYVVINDGGVRVGSMFVDASGYTFDLMGGGGLTRNGGRLGERGTLNNIEATGRVDLGASTIVVGIDYNAEGEIVTGQIIAQGNVTVNGATVSATLLVENIDFAEVIRLDHNGVLDLDILVSEGGTVVDHGNGVNVNMADNPFYSAEFVIDENRGSRFGTLRLSYFLYENLAKVERLGHNSTEAGKALDVIRHIRTGDSATDDQFRRWIGSHQIAAMDTLRGTELVANSLSMAMWRPWELTHQRTRNVREESGWNSWGGSYYQFGNTSSDGNARKYDLYRGGAMIGADYGSNRYWQFGGAFGYGMPKIQGHHGKVEADDLTLGAYSKINFFDQAWVSSFIGYGHQRYRMTRRGIFDDHLSKYGGDAWYASVEFVRPITVSIVTFMPLIALDHQTAWTKSFTESGYWGQTLAGTSMDRTMVRFGVDSKIVGIGGGDLRVDFATRLQAAVLVDGDKKAKVVSHFPMSGAAMTLHGVDIGWGQINAGLTTSGEWRQRYQWFFDVDGFLTERTTALQGQIGASTRW